MQKYQLTSWAFATHSLLSLGDCVFSNCQASWMSCEWRKWYLLCLISARRGWGMENSCHLRWPRHWTQSFQVHGLQSKGNCCKFFYFLSYFSFQTFIYIIENVGLKYGFFKNSLNVKKSVSPMFWLQENLILMKETGNWSDVCS